MSFIVAGTVLLLALVAGIIIDEFGTERRQAAHCGLPALMHGEPH
jgi:hypothetical protein